ncbi:MAG: N-acetylmuramoyl-L-alanine amidase [Candidatus Margulisbacteria bacterium]|nr:N-acetylmuramoyl-L-alanine amidase [Candidatus Margulisiibacteriota bacterium]
MRFILCITLVLKLSVLLFALPSTQTQKDIQLFFNKTPIELDTPALIREDTYMIPIKDILSSLKGSLSYSRRLNAYIVSITDQYEFVIVPNAKDFLFNGQSRSFKNAPVEYQHTLYVPIKAFLSLLNYTLSQKGNEISIVKSSHFKAHIRKPSSKPQNQPSTHFVIHDIHQSIKNGRQTVLIKSSGTLSPAIWSAQNPPRLIIDFKGSICKLNPIYWSSSSVYGKIRTSQLSHTPLFTRLVFDLHEDTLFSKNLSQNGREFEISFPLTTATPPATPKSSSKAIHLLKGKTIYLDPGHGGYDPGAIGYRGEKEKEHTLDISQRLEALLKSGGARVIMARKNDSNPTLGTRTREANNTKSDLLISIHINSFNKTYAKGIETYYYKKSDKILANHLHKELVNALKLRNNGLKKETMYILHHSNMPSALIEPCFMTNPHESWLINQPSFRQKIANATYKGILNYYKENG